MGFLKDRDGDYESTMGKKFDIADSLPIGVYRTIGKYLRPEVIHGDKIVQIDNFVSRAVLRETATFLDPDIRSRLRSAGLKNRRGIILHGPPGSGKTTLLRTLFPSFIEAGAIVLLDPNVDALESYYIPEIRRDNPDVPIVLVLDEFDRVLRGSEGALLSLLDGINSPDNILTLATINDISSVPARIRSRPSRFGLVLEMPGLTRDDRIGYVKKKFPTIEPEVAIVLVDIVGEKRPLDYLEEAARLSFMGFDLDDITQRIETADAAAIAVAEDDD